MSIYRKSGMGIVWKILLVVALIFMVGSSVEAYTDTLSFFFKRTTNYTDAQISACKTTYAVIGDPASRVRFRKLAPKCRLLFYRDVRTTRETEMAGGWTDYPVIKQWIVKDTTGNIIYDKTYPYMYLLDLTVPACQDLIAYEISKMLKDWDGIYLDEAAAFNYANRYSAPMPQYLMDGWRQGVNATIKKIRALIGTKIIIGNVGSVYRTLSSCEDMDWVHDEATMGTVYNCK